MGGGTCCRRARCAVRSRSIPAWAGEPHATNQHRPERPVYPRVGGGTLVRPVLVKVWVGLSPRGRGNPHCSYQSKRGARSIPAWAGEPACHRNSVSGFVVYPRVGGGTMFQYIASVTGEGLSPRGRGNHRPSRSANRFFRSIPAWAGEPVSPWAVRSRRGVYPRVGGGTCL